MCSKVSTVGEERISSGKELQIAGAAERIERETKLVSGGVAEEGDSAGQRSKENTLYDKVYYSVERLIAWHLLVKLEFHDIPDKLQHCICTR